MATLDRDVVTDNMVSSAVSGRIVYTNEPFVDEDEDSNPLTADSGPPDILEAYTDDRRYNMRMFQQAMQNASFEPLKEFAAAESTVVSLMSFLAAYPQRQRQLYTNITSEGVKSMKKRTGNKTWTIRLVEDARDVSAVRRHLV